MGVLRVSLQSASSIRMAFPMLALLGAGCQVLGVTMRVRLCARELGVPVFEVPFFRWCGNAAEQSLDESRRSA